MKTVPKLYLCFCLFSYFKQPVLTLLYLLKVYNKRHTPGAKKHPNQYKRDGPYSRPTANYAPLQYENALGKLQVWFNLIKYLRKLNKNSLFTPKR